MPLLTAPFPLSTVDLAGISRMALNDLRQRQTQEEEIRAQNAARQDATWKTAASMVMNIQDQQWKAREADRRDRNDLIQIAMETRKLDIEEQKAQAMADYRNKAYDPEANPLYGAKITTEQARADATAALTEQRKANTKTPEEKAQEAEADRLKAKAQEGLIKNRELDAEKKQYELDHPEAKIKPPSPSSISASANNQFGVQRDRLEQTRANISSATKNQTAVQKQLTAAEEKLKEAEMISKSYDAEKQKRNPQGYQMVKSELDAAKTEVDSLRKKKAGTRVTVFRPDGTTAEVPIDEARAYHTEWNRQMMNDEEKFRKSGGVTPLQPPAAGASDLPKTPGVTTGPGATPHRKPIDGLPLPTVNIEKFKTSNGLDDATMSVVTDILFGS